MIGSLNGLIINKKPSEVLIEVKGIGYEVHVPLSTSFKLPAINQTVQLLTHLIVREDQHTLYGFITEDERKLFRALIKISGVGAKLALTILSGINVEGFIRCVQIQDVDTLVHLPGIGKKTAERLLIEMRDRLKDWQITSLTPATDAMPVQLSTEQTFVNGFNDPFRNNKGDATNALISLGYKQAQADKAVKLVYSEGMSSEDIIRLSLKSML